MLARIIYFLCSVENQNFRLVFYKFLFEIKKNHILFLLFKYTILKILRDFLILYRQNSFLSTDLQIFIYIYFKTMYYRTILYRGI